MRLSRFVVIVVLAGNKVKDQGDTKRQTNKQTKATLKNEGTLSVCLLDENSRLNLISIDLTYRNNFVDCALLNLIGIVSVNIGRLDVCSCILSSLSLHDDKGKM